MKLGWALLGVASIGVAGTACYVLFVLWSAMQLGLQTGARMEWPNITAMTVGALVVLVGAVLLTHCSFRQVFQPKARANASKT